MTRFNSGWTAVEAGCAVTEADMGKIPFVLKIVRREQA
jgi:hypothetical protein